MPPAPAPAPAPAPLPRATEPSVEVLRDDDLEDRTLTVLPSADVDVTLNQPPGALAAAAIAAVAAARAAAPQAPSLSPARPTTTPGKPIFDPTPSAGTPSAQMEASFIQDGPSGISGVEDGPTGTFIEAVIPRLSPEPPTLPPRAGGAGPPAEEPRDPPTLPKVSIDGSLAPEEPRDPPTLPKGVVGAGHPPPLEPREPPTVPKLPVSAGRPPPLEPREPPTVPKLAVSASHPPPLEPEDATQPKVAVNHGVPPPIAPEDATLPKVAMGHVAPPQVASGDGTLPKVAINDSLPPGDGTLPKVAINDSLPPGDGTLPKVAMGDTLPSGDATVPKAVMAAASRVLIHDPVDDEEDAQSRRSPYLFGAIAFVSVLLMGLIGLWAFRGPSEAPPPMDLPLGSGDKKPPPQEPEILIRQDRMGEPDPTQPRRPAQEPKNVPVIFGALKGTIIIFEGQRYNLGKPAHLMPEGDYTFSYTCPTRRVVLTHRVNIVYQGRNRVQLITLNCNKPK